MKLAMSQNLQRRFTAEFGQALRELAQRQISFIRQQSNSQLALSTLFSILGAMLLLIGFALDVGPSTLLTLLLVITRMSGPTGQIQQGLQQLANVLPVYRKVTDMKQELAGRPHQPAADAGTLPPLDGSVTFEDVTFVHPGEEGDDRSRAARTVSASRLPQANWSGSPGRRAPARSPLPTCWSAFFRRSRDALPSPA